MNCRTVSFIYVDPALAHLLTLNEKSGWLAGQPKIHPMFRVIGSGMLPQWLPCQKLSSSHTAISIRHICVPLGLNLGFCFIVFPTIWKKVQMIVTLATVPAAFGWQESITLHIYFFSLSFTLFFGVSTEVEIPNRKFWAMHSSSDPLK